MWPERGGAWRQAGRVQSRRQQAQLQGSACTGFGQTGSSAPRWETRPRDRRLQGERKAAAGVGTAASGGWEAEATTLRAGNLSCHRPLKGADSASSSH